MNKKRNNKPKARHQGSTPRNEINETTRVIASDIPTPPSRFKSPEADEHDPTPKWKKRLEIIAFLVACVYAFFTILIWHANTKAADAAKSAAETARSQLELAERPWVVADLTSVGPIIHDATRTKIQFSIKIENVGHSPAVNVNIIPKVMERFSLAMADPAEQQKTICSGAKTIKLEQAWGRTLFPGKDFTQTFLRDVSKDELKPDIPIPLNIRTKDSFEPYILGCVDYTIAFSGEHHQTFFIYDLWGTSKTGSITRLIRGVDTPANQIKFFSNSPFSGGAN